jgi:hypothetical protein
VNAPDSSERVLYVFYDIETPQYTKLSDKPNEHVPILVCLQQLCSKCDNISDIEQDCIQCGKRIHSFLDDPVGDMLSYLCESRTRVENIVANAHNAKAFVLHVMINRAILLKCQVKLIMNGMKIMCMRVCEYLLFLDSISFLPFALRTFPVAFVLTVAKLCYQHYFNTHANLDYVGRIRYISYYGVDEMSAIDSFEFLAWYGVQKVDVFHKR